MEAHAEEVKRIARKVQEFYNAKEKFRITHGSSNSTRPTSARAAATIDTSKLDNILRVDVNNSMAVVEANVAMDVLLEETLKHDLMPLVMTEFPGITVGGAFSGTAGESSSFKHGYFDHTVSEIEMISPNGEVMVCSEQENGDIFKAAPGALGTLGIVTLLHVRLEKAFRFVEVTYHPFKELNQGIEILQRLASQCNDSIDFLDGILFSQTKGVVVTGCLTDSNPTALPVQRFIRPKDPWFFMHAESQIDKSPLSPIQELVPLPDYIFRYNRGVFWLGKRQLDILGVKSSTMARKLSHHAFTARMSYARVHMQPVNSMMIQDLAIPFPAAEEFIKWSDEKLGVFPLWLCPLRVPPLPTLHPHPLNTSVVNDRTPDLMLNVGLYDITPKHYDEWIKLNRDLEDKVSQVGGMKWAYAGQMYSEDEFWKQHDRQWYDSLRRKCHATSLPTIYEKTWVDVEKGAKYLEELQAKREKSLVGRRLPIILDTASFAGSIFKSFREGTWKMERSSAWYDWPDPYPVSRRVSTRASIAM